MDSSFAEAIQQIIQDKGISRELVLKTVEDFLLAAYKRTFGTTENAVIRFSEEGDDVALYAKKQIVKEVEDPVFEISLEEALEYNENCEIGDELLIEINTKEFDRIAIQSAKQRVKQDLREIQKDTLYSEYKDKVNEMIIGYYQRERNGNIFVDLGRTEGILPKKYQSPREFYRPNDRIKTLIYEVNKTGGGVQIVLSRTHAEFVKRIFELEVPEIYDRTVEIKRIVREPGYRTKLAVVSNRDDVDPVGACVGMKGVRIQAIVRELEGEKIDILKYDSDPRVFIKNALSPAQVKHVLILEEDKKKALAVVEDSMLSLAIGKQGLNVRLANRLVDWSIDVKTESQFAEMDISEESKRAVSALFGDDDQGDAGEEITEISELPGISERLVEILRQNGIVYIEALVALQETELLKLEGVTPQDAESIQEIIKDNVEIIEEDEGNDEEEAEYEGEDKNEEISAAEENEDDDFEQDSEKDEVDEDDDEPEAESASRDLETYECPECGGEITIEMESCPNCGVGLSFEIESDEGDEA